MHCSNRLSVALPLAALPLALSVAALATDYAPGRAARVVTHTELEVETTDMSITVNGEPMDWGGDRGQSSTTRRRSVHVDRVLASEEGRPTRVVRSFEDVGGDSLSIMGDREDTAEVDSPLNGAAIEITVEDGEVDVREAEGSDSIPGEALEGHRPTLALDALLPSGDVAEGASWDLDAEAVARALGLDVQRALYPRPEREEGEGGGGPGGGRRRGPGGGGGGEMGLFAQAEWEGEATLTSLEEDVDGRTCAVIELEISAEGELPEPEWGGGGRRGRADGLAAAAPRAALEGSFEITLEGRLAFDVERRLPVLLELEGSFTSDRTMERSRGDRDMVIEMTREGLFTHRVSIEPVSE